MAAYYLSINVGAFIAVGSTFAEKVSFIHRSWAADTSTSASGSHT